ncbi:MAG: GMC family oxidoreductase [Gemmatimonadetes bacterium]|nr:GMC family oxidoreductase [Gemmatimonadota bacterium]
MIIQGDRITSEVSDRADAVVIGTGAGGGTVAAYLAERGWNVVMLERGAFLRAQDFTQREEDAMADFNGRRGLDSTIDNAVLLNYAQAVGGSTVHYWGDSFRTPADRLEQWRTRWGLDWMTPAELNPHWDVLERELGIHICEEPLFNENNRLVRQGCEALGIVGGAVPTARVDCIGCGWTQFGCAYNRKSSQLITSIPRVSRAGGRVYSDALVERLRIENGRVTGVEGSLLERGAGRGRGRFRVDADVVVLAGGALGTAELLLRNLGADDVVGERLYINPHYFIFADFAREIDNVTGIPCAYSVHHFRRVEHSAGDYAGGGYTMLCSHQSPGITGAILSETGAAHTERMRRYRRLGSLMSVIDEENPGRVFLEDGVRKSWYRVRGVDALKAVDYLQNAARIFLAAGAHEVWIPDVYGTVVRNEAEVRARITLRSVQPNAQFCAGSHLLGTAPLGVDPARAFARPTGEAHRVRGLYVADGAAIPTSVSVDPSLTIMGVARWIAAGVHDRHGRAGA